MRKILTADTLTPILAYMRVQGEHKVILESIPREKKMHVFQSWHITQSLKSNMKMAS